MRVSHIHKRLEQQITLRRVIENSYDNFIGTEALNITNQKISSHLSSLKETWEKFSVINDSITVSIVGLDPEDKNLLHNHVYFTESVFSTTQDRYQEEVEKLTSFLDSEPDPIIQSVTTPTISQHSNGQHSNNTTFVQHTRLPRISIPQFSGLQHEWLSFKDMFTSIVGSSPNVSAVEKMQYLKQYLNILNAIFKSSLVGSASLLIKNTSITSDNFQKAWESLIAFYENKRLLINDALQSLFSLKRLTKDSASELEQLYSTITQIYRTLENLDCPVAHWDHVLVFVATQRLDAELLKAWENTLGSSKDPPTWIQFSEFLFSRVLSLQAFEKSRHGKAATQVRPQPTKAKVNYQGKSKESAAGAHSSCCLCTAKHFISSCPQYVNKTIQQKLGIISKHKLCYNCLGRHRVSECRITKRCLKCGRKHHTTIHQSRSFTSNDKGASSTKVEPFTTTSQQPEAKVLHSSIVKAPMIAQVLLATAQVLIISKTGLVTKVGALIDQGSEVSIITGRIVQRLRLQRKHSSLSLIGLGNQSSNKTRGIASFTLKHHFDSSVEYLVSAHILPKLTSSIPSTKVDSSSWSHLDQLELADPKFTKPGSIDLILGANIYCLIIKEGIIKGVVNTPIAQNTTLGWIISGQIGLARNDADVHSYHVKIDESLHDLLRRFWETEDISISKPIQLSADEQKCENHFKATHTRDSSGRYVVRLPFKDSAEKLGDSKIKASRVLTSLFNKLSSNSTYAKSYKDFIHEYEALHHMERVVHPHIEPDLAYYLPHHGVWREHSLSTRLRVVFNGSSNTTTGISLNQLLHCGAKLQLNLFNVLIWFRLFHYVFFADIEKMYRQILIHPDDWNFQRILWMNDFNKIIIYVLITVTYGLACAPFLALHAFRQLILDEGHRFSLALPTMEKGIYVDDYFGGADTVREAKIVVDQIENSTLVHALGLCWQPSTDDFHFTLNLTTTSIITKRTILSTIAKLFDPLGLLSPITISAKIFIQELWSNGLGWDDKLPSPLSEKWTAFISQLRDMPKFTFPRWLGFQATDTLEMHGFCDASTKAMAAVVFIRSVSKEGRITVNLVASKTKVAPLKRLTIPRLELSGAVLLVKLMSQVLRVLERNNIPIYGWIDSSVAHTWITNHPSRWKEFVQNRVCWIQETLPQVIWKLVPGTQNSADLATRGLTPVQLLEHVEWWTGPQWLQQDSSTWPQEPTLISHKDNLEERST